MSVFGKVGEFRKELYMLIRLIANMQSLTITVTTKVFPKICVFV